MPVRRIKKIGSRDLNVYGLRKPVHRGPRSKLKSLLILECDATQLATQSLSIANDLHKVVRMFCPNVNIAMALTTSQQDLLLKLSGFKEEHVHFDLIVVIAHSNQSGLRLTSDGNFSWEAFTQWVAPFEPNQMIFAACEAGQLPQAQALFDGIPTLKEIYAPPLKTTKNQVEVVKFLVPYLLIRKSKDTELIRIAQMVNYVLTGGVIFRWTRKECQTAGFAKAVEWKVFQNLIAKLRGV